MISLARVRRRRRASAVIAAAIVCGSAVSALCEGPAVSDLNAKISGFGGTTSWNGDRDGMGGVAGSITAPVGHEFGLQIDAAYARIGDGNFGDAGAHFFWRDPSVGLLGVYTGFAIYDRNGGVTIGRSGVEAQYFMGALTFDTAAGYEYGEIHKGYGRARIEYYPLDDVMLRAGWAYESKNLGVAGVEYQFANTKDVGMSMFVDGNVGADQTYSVIGGLKVTFGESMSLKDRHRRQDPESYQQFDMQTAQGATKPVACPFTPQANLCGVVSLPPKTYAKIGVQLQSQVTHVTVSLGGRLKQCRQAGYTPANPGPDSCGCAVAFSKCSPG